MNEHLPPLILQNPDDLPCPSLQQFQQWLEGVQQQASFQLESGELILRVVSEDESQQLNHDYRGKNKATNVLSFSHAINADDPQLDAFEIHWPSDSAPSLNAAADDIDSLPAMLGDLVICSALVEAEAQAANITAQDHWAHLFIHGLLHLHGYDHIEDDQAEAMEALEIQLLAQLSIDNPYEIRR